MAKEFTYSDKEFFKSQRDYYLTRVEEEILRILPLFSFLNNERDFQKEISIGIISHLIRKCFELNLIKDKTIKDSLNSIIHVHEFLYINDGSVKVKSDFDIKNKRGFLTIDTKFLIELDAMIKKWKKLEL